jgi:two-component system phosphate regulon sensor histidine kinase PhoR
MPVAAAVLLALAAATAAAAAAWRIMRRQVEAAHSRIAELAAALERQQEAGIEVEVMEALAEAAYNALILVNEERRVLHMNTPAQDLFSRDIPPGPEGENTLIAVTREHELDSLVTDTLAGREDVGTQLTLHGSAYRVRTHYAVTAGDGPVVAIALEDVSELQRLGRARRDMVANISHELRTPITSIRLLVDTLAREKTIRKGKDRAKELLSKITAETDTLQQMAQELLDLAMIESGRAEILMTPLDVREVLDAAVEQLSEQMKRGKIDMEVEAPKDLMALADGEQIRRVLTNLLHNAIKFTPKDGKITIEAHRNGDDWLTISVTDTGPGIPLDERDRIFERFYRGDRARRGGGTGLGLAIAKHIVQAHGGRIWAEESPTPPGARILFTLPTPDN